MSGKQAGRQALRAALQSQKDKARQKKLATKGTSGVRNHVNTSGKKTRGSRNNASDNKHRKGIGNTVWYAAGDEGPVEEPVKPCVLVKAASGNAVCQQVLRDFAGLLKPFAVSMKEDRRNFAHRDPWRPFEDIVPFEIIAQNKGAGWIVHASHSKKRPHNLTLMRFYSGHILDMAEVGTPTLAAPPAAAMGGGWAVGNKPCFLFIGEEFDMPESPLQRLANMIVDLFGGHRASKISLRGLEHVICVTYAPPEASQRGRDTDDSSSEFSGDDAEMRSDDDDGRDDAGSDSDDDESSAMPKTDRKKRNQQQQQEQGRRRENLPASGRRNDAVPGIIHFRTYQVRLKKSGTKNPYVELVDMGPNMDWELRRTRFASRDLYREACRVPSAGKQKKVKNVSTDAFAKTGRLHMQQQDLKTLRQKKARALKRREPEEGGETGEADADSEFAAGGRKTKQARHD